MSIKEMIISCMCSLPEPEPEPEFVQFMQTYLSFD